MPRRPSERAALALLAVVAAAAPSLEPDAAAAQTSGGELRTHLPIVAIDAPRAIPDDPKLRARMRVIDRPGQRRNSLRSAANGYSGQIAIELRGQSSQRFPKKSYGFETVTRRDDNRNVSLLGLPRENDWILYAPYNDKTLMRNAIAYETANRVGRYASRTRYVELVLDGRYQGVYVLMETPKIDDERVRLAGRGLGGGYLLEFTFADQVRPSEAFRLPVTRRAVAFQDPDAEDLSRRERAWITRYLIRAERALYGPRFRSPTRGWRAHIDEATLIDYVLLNELFKNQDAFRASTYLAKGAGAKLQLGPIWDFDIAMGNSNYGESRVLAGWLLPRRDWAERLYRDRRFTQAMVERWQSLRGAGLREELLRSVDRHVAEIGGAQERNFRRWPVLGQYVWPNPVDPDTGRVRTSYESEVAFLSSWLERRIEWIDANIGQLSRRGRGG